MKKIMFNDKYSLTAAVLEGKKTMTRRIIKAPRRTIEGKEVCGFAIHKTSDGVPYEVWLTGPDEESLCQLLPTYKIGEIVAVAQPYKVLDYNFHGFATNTSRSCGIKKEYAEKQKGWGNKMFVESKFTPHHIRITDIKLERLQDISEEDCVKEGILHWKGSTYENLSTEHFHFHGCNDTFSSAKEAFAALIDKVSGKGTWDRNPWAFAYSFVLID